MELNFHVGWCGRGTSAPSGREREWIEVAVEKPCFKSGDVLRDHLRIGLGG